KLRASLALPGLLLPPCHQLVHRLEVGLDRRPAQRRLSLVELCRQPVDCAPVEVREVRNALSLAEGQKHSSEWVTVGVTPGLGTEAPTLAPGQEVLHLSSYAWIVSIANPI